MESREGGFSSETEANFGFLSKIFLQNENQSRHAGSNYLRY